MGKKKKVWLALLVVVLVVAVSIGAARMMGASREKGYRVETMPVTLREFVMTASAEGTVAPVEEYEVRSPVTGRLATVAVEAGDHIQKGTILAWLSSQERLAEVAAAKAELEDARINLQSAEKNLARLKKLYEAEAATAREVDEANARLQSAQARFQAAQKRYQAVIGEAGDGNQPWAEVKDTRIVSQVSGVVTAVLASDGQAVTAGMPLVKVADLSHLVVKALVGEADAAMVQVGQEVLISTDATPGQKIRGVVTRIAPEAVMEGNVAKFPVEVAIQEGGGNLKPGMSADLEIVVYRVKEAIAIPFQAVIERGKNGESTWSVFVVRDGRAREVKVTIGRSNTSETEILSGLKVGDEVITGDYQTLKKLKDGDAVRPIKPKTEVGR